MPNAARGTDYNDRMWFLIIIVNGVPFLHIHVPPLSPWLCSDLYDGVKIHVYQVQLELYTLEDDLDDKSSGYPSGKIS